MTSSEEKRLRENKNQIVGPWERWGPYVSERSWATVREDLSPDENAWNSFSYEESVKRAYRFGEDGIAGWCDRYQTIVFAPAFWNGSDPIIKERLFGLTPDEANHGEDVKECYYHLDATPTHSYMKYLYRYPHNSFPYEKLRDENKNRGSHLSEYELVDTNIFNEGRYFDIEIEYAKEGTDDICILIKATNKGDTKASLHMLFQLWFRNQWSWDIDQKKPVIKKHFSDEPAVVVDDSNLTPPDNLLFEYRLGKRYLYGSKGGRLLFTHNDSALEEEGYYKDAIQKEIVQGKKACNPENNGTKVCFHYPFLELEPKKTIKLTFRFVDKELKSPLNDVESIVKKRKKEADAFYESMAPKKATKEEKQIQKAALSAAIWSKQIYLFDVSKWLKREKEPLPHGKKPRNLHWGHLNSMRILLMPDKWEYPWFAAWDQAFHSLVISLVDLEFAKEQLWLLLFDQFQHPNGAIPAYEWEFSDLNPPVLAWAALSLFEREKKAQGHGDHHFLERCFHKLLINFAWWVNRVDSAGNNVFEGGFLGLDNITIFDRSESIEGAVLEQSDGTGWMAMFCLNLMRMALILAEKNSAYESMATKFFQHYVYIAAAMRKRGESETGLWNDEDGFFYDILCYPDGRYQQFRVRSLVGIIPLFATEFLDEKTLKKFPEFARHFHWFLKNRSHLTDTCVTKWDGKYLLAPMTISQMKRVLTKIWDEEEFRAPFGMRSLSLFHEKNPFEFEGKKVTYEPNESHEKIKGGNSNWRGPVWMPTNYLLVNSLKRLAYGLGEGFTIEDTKGQKISLKEMSKDFTEKLLSLFKKDKDGDLPYLGKDFPYKDDPSFCDHYLFYEYFNPETGKGLGASHQSGWTALLANLIDEKE